MLFRSRRMPRNLTWLISLVSWERMVTPIIQCSTLSCRSTQQKHTERSETQTNPPIETDVNKSSRFTHTHAHTHTHTESLHTHRYLEEACDVSDDVPEDVVILLAVEPAQLGDSGIELDQSLSHKRRQLWPSSQVVEHIVPWRGNTGDPHIQNRKTSYH